MYISEWFHSSAEVVSVCVCVCIMGTPLPCTEVGGGPQVLSLLFITHTPETGSLTNLELLSGLGQSESELLGSLCLPGWSYRDTLSCLAFYVVLKIQTQAAGLVLQALLPKHPYNPGVAF